MVTFLVANLPSAVEMETLNELTVVLKPFEYVTREASGQKYITIFKIIPMLNWLTTELNSITPNSTIINECKDVLLRELKKRCGMIELNDHAAIVVLLLLDNAPTHPSAELLEIENLK